MVIFFKERFLLEGGGTAVPKRSFDTDNQTQTHTQISCYFYLNNNTYIKTIKDECERIEKNIPASTKSRNGEGHEHQG